MTGSAKLPYALDGTGRTVSVNDVPNGLDCNCSCPACGARLVAKQGTEQVWHFSHYHGENCQAGYESALHLAVKALLEQDPQLALPTCMVVRHEIDKIGPRDKSRQSTWSGAFEYVTDESEQAWARDLASVHDRGLAELPGRLVRFDRVEVEQTQGNIRPDLIAYVGDRRINLEVAVTHFIDEEKLGRIRKLGFPTLEIVIPPSLDPDWGTLRNLLHSPENKYWRFNPLAEQKAEADFEARRAARNEQRQRDAKLQMREAEMRREQREKEARLRQREAEIRQRKAALREGKYKLIAEVILHRGDDSFHLRWNKSNVNLSLYRISGTGVDVLSQVARGFAGTLNKAGLQWEFPTEESMFFRIASAVKAEGSTVGKFHLPEDMDSRAAFGAICDLLMPVETVVGIQASVRRSAERYRVTYRYSDQFVSIVLDYTSISLRVVPYCHDEGLRDRIIEIARQLRGSYNKRTSVLEFPPVEANFFAIARAMRPDSANQVSHLVHPEGMRTFDVLLRLGFGGR